MYLVGAEMDFIFLENKIGNCTAEIISIINSEVIENEFVSKFFPKKS